MTIEMVKVLVYVRRNPGSSKDSILKELKLTKSSLELTLASLKTKQLISIDANEKIFPLGENE